MSGRILVEATSLTNPLAEAWRRAFEFTGLDAHGVLIPGREPLASQLPPKWSLAREVTGGDVVAVVSWWGLASASDSLMAKRYPDARHAVIVDTYPNAARVLTELREWVKARVGPSPDVAVCYSDEMANSLAKHRIFPPSTEITTLLQPFPLGMHRAAPHEPEPHSIIFTGRSDYLFSRDRSMAKDALGAELLRFITAGYEVAVGEPHQPDLRSHLRRQGFTFYPRLTNSEVLSGQLGEIIAAHGFQYCSYSATSPTIKRRLRNGLSSRFALGLTSETPILVSPHAVGAARLITDYGIGLVGDHPSALQTTASSPSMMRRAWRRSHVRWSAEGRVSELRSIVGV